MGDSENAIIGDQYPVELPDTAIDEVSLDNEKRLARFSKTKEFKRLKEAIEAKIAFYKTWLPSGEHITDPKFSMEELGRRWMVASAVIAELQSIIDAYEQANEVVKDV